MKKLCATIPLETSEIVVLLPPERSEEMKAFGFIMLFFILSLSGHTTPSKSVDKEPIHAGSTAWYNKIETNIAMLYNAVADNRNALHEDSNACTPYTGVRLLTNRNRIVNHNTSLRQVLLATNKPVVAKLIHHPVSSLIAFPKEYHIFRLRRILI